MITGRNQVLTNNGDVDFFFGVIFELREKARQNKQNETARETES